MKSRGIPAVATILLVVGIAGADVIVGTGAASVSTDGSIFVDLKGVCLYQVYVSVPNPPHGRNEYSDSFDILTFDSGRTMPRRIEPSAATENLVDALSYYNRGGQSVHVEDWGEVVFGTNIISTALPNIDPETEEILSWNESRPVDTYVNVNMAALEASGNSLLFMYQVVGSAPIVVPVTVPEPVSLALLALGGTVMLRRRK